MKFDLKSDDKVVTLGLFTICFILMVFVSFSGFADAAAPDCYSLSDTYSFTSSGGFESTDSVSYSDIPTFMNKSRVNEYTMRDNRIHYATPLNFPTGTVTSIDYSVDLNYSGGVVHWSGTSTNFSKNSYLYIIPLGYVGTKKWISCDSSAYQYGNRADYPRGAAMLSGTANYSLNGNTFGFRNAGKMSNLSLTFHFSSDVDVALPDVTYTVSLYDSSSDYYFEVDSSAPSHEYMIDFSAYKTDFVSQVNSELYTSHRTDLSGVTTSSDPSWLIGVDNTMSIVTYPLSLPKQQVDMSLGYPVLTTYNYSLTVSDNRVSNIGTVSFGGDYVDPNSENSVTITPSRNSSGNWNVHIEPDSTYSESSYTININQMKIGLPDENYVSDVDLNPVVINITPGGPLDFTITDIPSDYNNPPTDYGYYYYTLTVSKPAVTGGSLERLLLGSAAFGSRYSDPPGDTAYYVFKINGNSRDFNIKTGSKVSIDLDAYDPNGYVFLAHGFTLSPSNILAGVNNVNSVYTTCHIDEFELNSSGIYNFTLYHGDGNGGLASAWKTIRVGVSENPPATPTPTPSPRPTQVPWEATGSITADETFISPGESITFTYTASSAGGKLDVLFGSLSDKTSPTNITPESVGLWNHIQEIHDDYDPELTSISGSFTRTFSTSGKFVFAIFQDTNIVDYVVVTVSSVEGLTGYSISVSPTQIEVGHSATFSWSGTGTGTFKVVHGWITVNQSDELLFEYAQGVDSISGSATMSFDRAGRYKFILYFNDQVLGTAILQIGVGVGEWVNYIDPSNHNWTLNGYLGYINFLKGISVPTTIINFQKPSEHLSDYLVSPQFDNLYSWNQSNIAFVNGIFGADGVGGLMSVINTVMFVPRLFVDMVLGVSDAFFDASEHVVDYITVPCILIALVVELIPDEVMYIALFLFGVDLIFLFMSMVGVFGRGALALDDIHTHLGDNDLVERSGEDIASDTVIISKISGEKMTRESAQREVSSFHHDLRSGDSYSGQYPSLWDRMNGGKK